MTKVPDDVIFGIKEDQKSIDYGYIRSVSDENELIRLLELRLGVFFENKVEPLVDSRSAFPLAVMTCIGIETLGEIFFKEDKDESARQFVNVTFELSSEFKKKPEKETLKIMNQTWSEEKMKGIKSKGHVLHNFFRNSMIHGFSAQAIYLSYEDTNDFIEIPNKGIFVMNPDWLWNRYKLGTAKLFKMAQSGKNHKQKRKNCLTYIQKMLE